MIPLLGDSKRRASPIVRGYLYQFWRTVSAWIDLLPEELLFVEGAEDYDVVTKGEATTIQIKDTKASGSLTLATTNAQEAINNYWSTRARNSGRKIQFKFITTAGAGVETPGFDGDKGVDIWNLCREAPLENCRIDIERIRVFLKTKTLSADVLKLLKTANTESLKKELIDPIEWIYDQPGLEGVEEIVIGRLLNLGSSQGLTVRDAETLSGRLCMLVARAASESELKRLDFVDLRRQLDEAVNIEIPRGALLNSEELVKDLIADSIGLGSTLPTIALAAENFTTPVLASTSWPRQILIDRVRQSMASGVVYISGGTGTGKTTLVLQALPGQGNVLWANLRDKSSQEILFICRSLRQCIPGLLRPHVVLDDLNPENDPRNVEPDIGVLASVVKGQEGSLIVTSYIEPRSRLAKLLGLTDDGTLAMPAFSQEEVQSYLRDSGCPNDLLGTLSGVVWLHTSGHPQLVAARVGTLKVSGFPKPSTDDFLAKPSDVEDVQSEARAVIRALPEPARKLLYRLSISVPPLRRSHILRIAASPPPIEFAGEIFDAVVGPWFEEVTPGHYRISPLLSKAGEQILASDDTRRINSDIAEAVLAEKTLTPAEFSGVIMHALIGEAEKVLAITANVFLTQSQEIKKRLAEDLTWITAIDVGPTTALPVSDPKIRRFFRLFQWEVAGLAAPVKRADIAAALTLEFEDDSEELDDILARVLYLSKLLIQTDFSMPVAEVVSDILEVKRLASIARERNSLPSFTEGVGSMYTSLLRPQLTEMFTIAIMPRVRTVIDLRALIEALDKTNKDEREWLLTGLSVEDGELRILFNRTWLSVPEDDEQAQEVYQQTLAFAVTAARRWGSHSWMRAATRTRSAVLDEFLNRRAEAELIVKEIVAEIGTSPNLEEQLAVIAYNRKEYNNALEIWERVLPQWHSDESYSDMQPVRGLRFAAISASRLGQWRKAAELYGQAHTRAKRFAKLAWDIGLRADRAFALWMARDFDKAVHLFSEIVPELEMLPNNPNSLAEYAVLKFVGHVLGGLSAPKEAMDYFPGMCSDLSPNKGISDLPAIPTIFLWFMLYQLAARVGDRTTATKAAEKVRDQPFAALRAMSALDRVERTIDAGELDAVLNLAAHLAVEMEKSYLRRDLPIVEPDSRELTADVTERALSVHVRPALWAALLKAKALGHDTADLLNRWRSSLNPEDVLLSKELQDLSEVVGMSAWELATALRDNRLEKQHRRLYAAIVLMNNEEAPLTATVYAHALIIRTANDHLILKDVGGQSFDGLLRLDWRRFIAAPFLLRNPRMYVGDIQMACNAVTRGWAPAARISLVGYPASGASLPTSILELFDSVSNGAFDPKPGDPPLLLGA